MSVSSRLAIVFTHVQVVATIASNRLLAVRGLVSRIIAAEDLCDILLLAVDDISGVCSGLHASLATPICI